MHKNSSTLALRRARLPIKDLDGNKQIPLQMMIQENHSGPIPSNKQMQGYKDIDPQLPDRIMTLAEKNAEHIRNKEILQLTEHYKDKNKGRNAGIVAIMGAFTLSGIAFFTGNPVEAALLGGTVVLGLATIFVLNQKAHFKENQDDE